MKKFFVCAAALCLVLMLCGFDFDDTVEKQLATAERGGVSDALPESAAEILKSLGVEEMSAQSLSEISFGDAVRLVGESIKERIRAPFLSVISVCAAGILCSVINNFGSGEMKTVYSAVCTLAAAAAVIIPVKNVLSSGARVITECSDFMLGFIPVYSSVIAASGGVSSAAGYRTLMLGASTAVARLAGNIIVPLMCVYLALCAAGTVAPIGIDSIAKGVKSFAVWVMSASAALFSGIMGVGSIVSSSADGAGAKAVKFVVGSAVPVVGGTVSDALAAAKSCLIMARNVLGAYAIVAAAVIFIPPVISAFTWKICLSLGAGASDMLDNKPLSSLLSASSAVMGIMLAMVLLTAITFIFSVTIMIIAGGAAV